MKFLKRRRPIVERRTAMGRFRRWGRRLALSGLLTIGSMTAYTAISQNVAQAKAAKGTKSETNERGFSGAPGELICFTGDKAPGEPKKRCHPLKKSIADAFEKDPAFREEVEGLIEGYKRRNEGEEPSRGSLDQLYKYILFSRRIPMDSKRLKNLYFDEAVAREFDLPVHEEILTRIEEWGLPEDYQKIIRVGRHQCDVTAALEHYLRANKGKHPGNKKLDRLCTRMLGYRNISQHIKDSMEAEYGVTFEDAKENTERESTSIVGKAIDGFFHVADEIFEFAFKAIPIVGGIVFFALLIYSAFSGGGGGGKPPRGLPPSFLSGGKADRDMQGH